MEKESRINITRLIKSYLETEMKSVMNFQDQPLNSQQKEPAKNLRKPVLVVALPCGVLVPISADVTFSAMDNKLTQTLTGRTGAFCTSCTNSASDMKDPKVIADGFYMNFGTDKLSAKFHQLAEKFALDAKDIEHCSIPSNTGDYQERLGQKKAPLTQEFEITKVLSILHATKLRAVPFIQEIIIRDLSGCRVWGSGRIPTDKKERYEIISLKWKEMLGPLLGFRGRQAPNQITGFLCDIFLSFGRRPAVLNCIKNLNIWREDNFCPITETELDNY